MGEGSGTAGVDLQHCAGDYFLSVPDHLRKILGKFFVFFFHQVAIMPCFLLRWQDILNKRNPRLVPYVLLDEKTKKTNRDSVNNAVRTLIGYGYNIEPPDQESSKLT